MSWPCSRQGAGLIGAWNVYQLLQKTFGPQGWWPVVSRAGQPGFDPDGYHPNLFDDCLTRAGRFEILVGAILTQNTAWRNVARVLRDLQAKGWLEPVRLADCSEPELAQLIRPAGYFNQKAKKLLIATRAGLEQAWWPAAGQLVRVPKRDELLGLWGIGPETADSILLYAWHQPTFVVDAYTRRWLTRLAGGSGDSIDPGETTRIYNEYHALIVRQAKEYCRATPRCDGCPFRTAGLASAPGAP